MIVVVRQPGELTGDHNHNARLITARSALRTAAVVVRQPGSWQATTTIMDDNVGEAPHDAR
jgi:hypothetical protein